MNVICTALISFIVVIHSCVSGINTGFLAYIAFSIFMFYRLVTYTILFGYSDRVFLLFFGLCYSLAQTGKSRLYQSSGTTLFLHFNLSDLVMQSPKFKYFEGAYSLAVMLNAVVMRVPGSKMTTEHVSFTLFMNITCIEPVMYSLTFRCYVYLFFSLLFYILILCAFVLAIAVLKSS